MVLLIAGLALFTGAHLFLSAASGPVSALKERFGANAVKGLVSLATLAGLILIVMGWRASLPTSIYTPPASAFAPATALIATSVYLFVVANRPSALKRIIRHPQLTGVGLFALGHLILNGDSRSLVLFASLGIWAIVSVILINRRDGAYQIPDKPAVTTDLITAATSLLVCAGLIWAHPWFAGVVVPF